MSELAVELRNRTGVYTRTTGNITQLFFQKEEDDGISRGSIRQFGAPEGAPGFPLYREAADAADQLEPAATHRPTARDLELAKPDTVDMAVMPLESYDQVHGMISYFETRKNLREACLLVFGFCTGLRISDLLQLKIGDIVTSTSPMTFKAAIDIREQKTGKRTVGHLDDMLITPAMQEWFIRYMDTKRRYEKQLDNYLFSTDQSHGYKPMSIRIVQLNLKPAFAEVCPHLRCSTHTMRKTFVSIIHAFASQATMSGAGLNPSTACQIALRHANASTTMAYMGTMKSGMLSLRRAVSDFVAGRTKIKSLRYEYSWETIDD